MPRQDTHPHNCDTCKNIDCEFWEEKPHMSAGHDEQTGWRASPGVVTFAVGCATHSSQPAPERPLAYTVGECMEQCQLARKAEREQVLEQLNELRRYSSDEYQESDLSDNEREMRIHVEYGNRIWGIMKSLRQQEEQR